ncbi:unnamed protein product, partial [Phaeothamnion confervicola]
DWSSGPDRYAISLSPEPEWGWARRYNFHAYAAAKYHVLECSDPISYRVVKGHSIAAEAGWSCILAFYAFDLDLLKSRNQYYVEELHEPHWRTRIGMTTSFGRWGPRLSFAAFDVPVLGAARFDVHNTVRSATELAPYPEQHRIHSCDALGRWEQQFSFYAFPAESV